MSNDIVTIISKNWDDTKKTIDRVSRHSFWLGFIISLLITIFIISIIKLFKWIQ